MRKTIIAIFILAIILGMTGCETRNIADVREQIAQKNEDVNSSEDVNQEETEPAVSKPEVAPESDMKTLDVSDWAYESVCYIDNKYYMVQKGDKYYLTDNQGTILDSDALMGMENGWDMFYPNLEDGTFALIRKLSEDVYDSYIWKSDDMLSVIFLQENWTLYATDYRDGVVKFESANHEGVGGYLTFDTHEQVLAYEESQTNGSAVNRGRIVVSSKQYMEGYGLSYLIDIEDVARQDVSPELAEKKTYESDGKSVVFMNNVPNKDGWICCGLNTIITDGDTINVDEAAWEYGFYNIDSGEFVPDSGNSCAYFADENGCQLITVQNDMAAVNGGDSDNPVYSLFDLKKQDKVNDKTYKYVSSGLKSDKYVLVKNMQDELGYIDGTTFEECGQWYEDATDFCNGYALVKTDGKVYLIDEKMQICSEGIEGDDILAQNDSYEYSDLAGKSLFYVKQDGAYHTVTVN